MANEEVQNGPGGTGEPPVDIETVPKKPKKTRKTSGQERKRGTAASRTTARKKGADTGRSSKAGGKRKNASARTKAGTPAAAGTKRARKRPPVIPETESPTVPADNAVMDADASTPEITAPVVETTCIEGKAPVVTETTCVEAKGPVVAETTCVETKAPALAPEVSVLQGAQVRLAPPRQIAVTPAPTVISQQVAPAGIVKVRNIDATLTSITAQIIPNKVIVQGVVHLQIFFVLADAMVHHLAEDVPFSTMLEIPGAAPGMNAVVQPKIAAVLFHLSEDGTVLVKKIVIDVFAKVVEEVQVNLVPGQGPPLLLQEVVGEGTVQTLNENFVTLFVPAVKVDEIRGEIRDVTTEVIRDKVIVQGTIHKQIFFVDESNTARHQVEEVHFSAFVDIPGAAPGMNLQVHPRIETIIFELIEPTTLRQKVVVETFVKVTTSVEFQATLGEGPLFHVAQVVGEGEGQILRRDVVTLAQPALKIREITAVLNNLRSHVLPGKAILQGTVHKQIFFIGLDNIERHQAEDVPFSIMVDIPAAAAGLDLVAEPVIEEVIFHLLSPTELEQKVIIRARLVVVDRRQLRLVTGAGPLVKVEQVVGENLAQVLVRLVNRFPPVPIQKRVVPIIVQQAVQRELVFNQQIIVENEVALPTIAIKIAEVSAQIQNLQVKVIANGILVSGEVVKDIKFVGEDNVVRNITEVVPFSILISIPDLSAELVQTVDVQIERILFNISPDGMTVRQIIVLLASATIIETTTSEFQLITEVEAPGLNVQTVLVEEPVRVDGGIQLRQFPVITGLSGPGLSLVVSSTFGVHTLQVVGDGQQALNVLEDIVLDP